MTDGINGGTKNGPDAMRDVTVRYTDNLLYKLKYMLSVNSRCQRDIDKQALELLRADDGTILAEVTDFVLTRIGYDVGKPRDAGNGKTRRRARAAV